MYVSRPGVLIAAPFLPWPANFGGAQRIHALARELQRDVDVTLVAPTIPDEEAHLHALGAYYDVVGVPARWSLRYPPSRVRRCQQLRAAFTRQSIAELTRPGSQFQQVIDRILQTRFIHVFKQETPYMASVHARPGIPTIIDAQNVEWDLLRRISQTSPSLGKQIYNASEWRKLRRVEQRAWAAADAVTVTSMPDAEAIAPFSRCAPILVPNGIDLDAVLPRRQASSEHPHDVLFIGALRHAPNADAVGWYLEHVHPIVRAQVPDARLHVVGADPPAWLRELDRWDVLVTGTVPSVQPWLADAAVAVLPLLSGGGTRIKALEAFAAQVPVVSTTIGVEGLNVSHAEHLLIADQPEAFAAAILATVSNADATRERATAARRLVEQRYSWAITAQPLRALVDSLLHQR